MQEKRSVNVAEPANEPLQAKELRPWLDIADTDSAHDPEIRDHIRAARAQWQRDTQNATALATVTENLGGFYDTCLKLSYGPVSAVTSIKYYDGANAQQTLASTEYTVDAPNQKIWLGYLKTWPTTVDRWDAVEIIYVIGAASYEPDAKHALKLLIKLAFGNATTAENDQMLKAYEALVAKHARASHP